MISEHGLTEAEAEIAVMGSRLFAAINWRDEIWATKDVDVAELRRAQEAVAAFRADFRQALKTAADGELVG